MLQLGRYSSLTWSRGGEQTGSIMLIAQQDGVRLRYQTKDRDGLALLASSTTLSGIISRPLDFGHLAEFLATHRGTALPFLARSRFGSCWHDPEDFAGAAIAAAI